jgi:hypothetical protein
MMRPESIQIARDCAAIVEICRIQTMIGVPNRQNATECCREIIRAIQAKWPEAFIEPRAPQLRKVEQR